MEDDLLSPESVVLLYVFWSSIDYSDYYINDLTDLNPKIYYINLASNVVAHVWLINTLIGSRFIQDLININKRSKNIIAKLRVHKIVYSDIQIPYVTIYA
ncbi:hypothetical protein RI543_001522 [Arxiozyma heterogenica]|uniref:Uncharacterized protein n=1 Tax=Arxiozyma heterogenica TaxID=278026 RepID=A0AAN7WJ10_9SACH|nr:hypothetical protein RI543_001522 [Kazachstania heterogenica]